jgi:hypothetical protein
LVWRWLAADPRDVVDLAGARELGEPAGGASLGEELRRWRRIVARRRLVVLARRHAAVALGLAALLEIAAQLGAFPHWVVVAVPLALFLVTVTALGLRGPSPFALARLLDDKLGLNDRLATALEIEARGGQSPLERRTVADAAALLAAGREDWHATPHKAAREWWALVGPAAAIGAVVAIGVLTAGNSSSSGRLDALGLRHGGRGGENELESEYVKHAEKHSKTLAPTGKLHKFKGKEGPPPSADKSASSGYQKIPQAERTGRRGKGHAGKGGGGNRPQSGDKLERGANSEVKGGEEKAGSKSGSGVPKEKEHPTLGFNVKSTGGNGNHARRGTSKVKGAAGKKAAPNGAGDQTTAGASESNKPGGSPAGGANHAGGEQGTNQASNAKPITGQASQAVRIQPAYAPSRSKKAEKEERKAGREEGAGGKARTGQVTGATQVGERFSFVPVTGGAVPGPSVGLQLNYLESLKWVERLPWG